MPELIVEGKRYPMENEGERKREPDRKVIITFATNAKHRYGGNLHTRAGLSNASTSSSDGMLAFRGICMTNGGDFRVS